MVCRLCHRAGVQESLDMFLGVVAQNQTESHRLQYHPNQQTEFIQVYAKKVKQNKPETEPWGLEGGVTKDPNKVYKYASRSKVKKSEQKPGETSVQPRFDSPSSTRPSSPAFRNVQPPSTQQSNIVQQRSLSMSSEQTNIPNQQVTMRPVAVQNISMNRQEVPSRMVQHPIRQTVPRYLPSTTSHSMQTSQGNNLIQSQNVQHTMRQNVPQNLRDSNHIEKSASQGHFPRPQLQHTSIQRFPRQTIQHPSKPASQHTVDVSLQQNVSCSFPQRVQQNVPRYAHPSLQQGVHQITQHPARILSNSVPTGPINPRPSNSNYMVVSRPHVSQPQYRPITDQQNHQLAPPLTSNNQAAACTIENSSVVPLQ